MKVKFFLPKPKGHAPSAPAVSIRRMGTVSINVAACALINAEPGEAATICFDEEGGNWLLAHWPNGEASQPALRAMSGKDKSGVRFQVMAACREFFEQAKDETSASVSCGLLPEAFTTEDAPGASFYVLAKPAKPATATGKGGNRG